MPASDARGRGASLEVFQSAFSDKSDFEPWLGIGGLTWSRQRGAPAMPAHGQDLSRLSECGTTGLFVLSGTKLDSAISEEKIKLRTLSWPPPLECLVSVLVW